MSDKLKIIFTNIKNFTEFKEFAICVKENIEFHTYAVTSVKTLTIALKSLIQLTRISENIRYPDQCGISHTLC